MKKLSLFLALCFICAFWFGYKKSPHICEKTNGKWASVDYVCIRSDCVKNHTCGSWANPVEYCPKIQIGMQKEMVYFWLGDPREQTNDKMIWNAHKVENGEIIAIFKHNQLTQFYYPKT